MKDNAYLNDISDIANNYNDRKTARFHMPGHKGVGIGGFLDPVLPYDLTELEDTDNMLDPQAGGAVEATEKQAERLFGSSCTILSCGGATLTLQTAILSVLRNSGSRLLVCDRRSHKSVVNALALCGGEPFWFDPTNPTDNLPNAAAMLVTSPDYYGEMLDIPALSDLAHRSGMPLICDNSHGSHLAFLPQDLHPLRCGADIVIDSIHKTLPALTGCALLHTSGDIFTRAQLKSAMRLFASTSPSYLIGASTAQCLRYLEREGTAAIACTVAQVGTASDKLRELGYTLRGGSLYDPARLCIRLAGADMLYSYLHQNGVVCEFADSENLVLLPSPMNTDTDYDRLIKLCAEWAEEHKPDAPDTVRSAVPYPAAAIPLRDAVLSDFEEVPLESAEGKICAAPAVPYPPGIPLIMPGERLDAPVIRALASHGFDHVAIVKQYK